MERNRATDVLRNGSIIAGVWFAYSVVRSFSVGAESVARQNAELVRAFQESLGVAIEPALQELFLTEVVGRFANTYYLLHFPVTVGLLVVTFFRSRDLLFPILRDSLVVMTGVGLAVHMFFPLAPPRMLDGIIDASLLYGPNPYDLPGSDAANQLAAMPSMHVAWAIALGWTILHTRNDIKLWIVGALHPLVTFFVVLVTGHHFLADVVVGCVVAIAALMIVSTVYGHPGLPGQRRQISDDSVDGFPKLSTS